MKIKAVSLWQPWATLMAYGLKVNETRSWSTKYRGPLAIHAAKRIETLTNPTIKLFMHHLNKKIEELPIGQILAICDLVDCKEIKSNNIPIFPERDFGDYTPGRFMWITENVQWLLRPIPTRGYQGLWNVEM